MRSRSSRPRRPPPTSGSTFAIGGARRRSRGAWSRFDRLVIQYHPDVFHRIGVSARDHAVSTAGLMVACRLAHESEMVVHEFDDEPLRYGRRNRALTARMWRSVDRLVFHTAIEREQVPRRVAGAR